MGRPKRNVLAAAESSMTPPDELNESQSLARVVKAEGNNLYSCSLPDKRAVIVELAERFRNTIWIKRGGYALIDLYPIKEVKGRVEGEIVNVVRDEREWRKQKYWPKEFVRVTDDDDDDESNVGKMPPSDSEDEE
ncbi:hypothetical protein JX265_003421 [Neoarthrinium moseri]|uniref:S1-like domain-containing protein n=1 Tax=Neoarthrinium moseri TaxID=1658444 RepID=A0A9P9WS81_9PEZI|nr:uncharacterized protein JN550_000745 [Neoarthrinium moseri]KAI1850047.1 hypothetical protein JX266_004426 [Neoarthrinium moseri]KAI1876673.1 hypothetical protein JN550_000745 [Neoarthrinium moseri]KAI1877413.1 hypothetical protein JX265_003421 [Neoarthrinium moseri]